jgi:phage tail P2-like protein
VTDLSLLPPNRSNLERAVSNSVAQIFDIPVPVRDVWNPDTCPTPLLPWLAQQFSVDTWDADWSEQQKRQVIRDSVFVHRHKGTIGAVRRALGSLGYDVQVQEWFNQTPLGKPYTFRLLLLADQYGIDQAGMRKILEVIESTKNLRSHLEEVLPTVKSAGNEFTASVTNIGSEVSVNNFMPVPLLINQFTILG